MGIPPIGTILLVNFPFADLKNFKKRPALVIAEGSLDTMILCQITSRELPGVPFVKLELTDYSEGKLPLVSYVRPDKLFTVDSSIKHIPLARISTAKEKIIRRQIINLFA